MRRRQHTGWKNCGGPRSQIGRTGGGMGHRGGGGTTGMKCVTSHVMLSAKGMPSL